MKAYFIRTNTYGTNTPHIIDEETMEQAEKGRNYLNPEEFMFHCEADSMNEAEEQYWKEFSEMACDYMAEKDYP